MWINIVPKFYHMRKSKIVSQLTANICTSFISTFLGGKILILDLKNEIVYQENLHLINLKVYDEICSETEINNHISILHLLIITNVTNLLLTFLLKSLVNPLLTDNVIS